MDEDYPSITEVGEVYPCLKKHPSGLIVLFTKNLSGYVVSPSNWRGDSMEAYRTDWTENNFFCCTYDAQSIIDTTRKEHTLSLEVELWIAKIDQEVTNG